jgi:hypothetical protein
MSGASKAGVTGGALVVAGALGGRCGDDVLLCGARQGTRMVDDVTVGAGGRMASWGPERAARHTVDDLARLGRSPKPLAGSADDVARGLRVRGAATPGMRGATLADDVLVREADDVPWFDTVVDQGIDVGIELVSFEFDGATPAVVRTPGEVQCPHWLDVTRTPDAWDELRGGFGVACAPVVVAGTVSADGGALRVGADDVPLPELARACAVIGARCVLVGCPALHTDACLEGTEDALSGARLRPALPAYVRGLVEVMLVQEVAPVVIAELATVDGEVKLVLAKPGAGGNSARER